MSRSLRGSIEDRIENLMKREAVIEQSKGKYRTDFLIYNDRRGRYCEENGERTILPIYDKLIAALKSITVEAELIDFYKAEKSADELFYLYGAMAFDHVRGKYSKMPYPEIPERFDGYRWSYVGRMESGAYKRITLNRFGCNNSGITGKYLHIAFSCFGGFAYAEAMYDNYIDACDDILHKGKPSDTNSAACAIRDGYIERHDDGTLFVKSPSFTKDQKAHFDAIADKYLGPIMDEYADAVNRLLVVVCVELDYLDFLSESAEEIYRMSCSA